MQCEVWSVQEAVGSEKCEVWSVKCAVWSVKFKFGVRRAQCEVWSVKCEVWSVKEAVRSEKCGVWSVKCGVWSLKFGVRRVQCAVWGVERRGKDTVGTGCLWTIGHLSLGNFRRRLARVYVNWLGFLSYEYPNRQSNMLIENSLCMEILQSWEAYETGYFPACRGPEGNLWESLSLWWGYHQLISNLMGFLRFFFW